MLDEQGDSAGGTRNPARASRTASNGLRDAFEWWRFSRRSDALLDLCLAIPEE